MTGEGAPAVARPWVQHYDPGVPAEVEILNVRIPELVEASVRSVPDRKALIFYGASWTFRRLWEESGRFAAGLARLGVSAGARVALYLPNSPAYPIAYLGTLRLGATVVQVSPLYLGDDLVTLLRDARPKAVVALDIHATQLIRGSRECPTPLTIVAPLRDFYPRLPRIFVNRVLHRHGFSTGIPAEPNVHSWASVMRSGPGREVAASSGSPEDVAVLQYTGGTTGVPKAAMLTHRNLVANVVQCRAWYGSSGGAGPEIILAVVPFFHIYGLTVVLNYALLKGGTVVLQLRPDTKETLKLIQRYRATHLPGVPALYGALAQHPEARSFNLRSVKLCASGSAPLPVEIQKRFEELTGARVVEGYGLSETSPVTHSNPLVGTRRIGSIGIPFPSTDQKVVDLVTGSRECPVGEEGELVVRGPQVMLGYLNQPGETSQTLRDGWFYTGDIARLDADGFAYIVDRKKDVINVGGFKVWPREVEEVLFQHPAVAEVAVIGVPDPTLGEVPFAYVVKKSGASVTADELIEFVRGRLAHYKAPRGVEFRESLPRSGVQKVLRRVLRESAGAAAAATAPAR